MRKFARVENGKVVEVIDAETGGREFERGTSSPPFEAPKIIADAISAGYIDTTEDITVGWRHAGGNFIAPPPATPAELQAEVDALTEQLANGNDRDKAIAMTLADLLKYIQPTLSTQQARNAVRNRFAANLAAIKGL